jgi:hypothetical protein
MGAVGGAGEASNKSTGGFCSSALYFSILVRGGLLGSGVSEAAGDDDGTTAGLTADGATLGDGDPEGDSLPALERRALVRRGRVAGSAAGLSRCSTEGDGEGRSIAGSGTVGLGLVPRRGLDSGVTIGLSSGFFNTLVAPQPSPIAAAIPKIPIQVRLKISQKVLFVLVSWELATAPERCCGETTTVPAVEG